MLVIGLTGDIGAGKSTVSSLLERMGAVVVDADKIVRQIWTRPEIIEAASKRWGRIYWMKMIAYYHMSWPLRLL